VHPEILRAEAVADGHGTHAFWKKRYRSIVDLEAHLHRNGTRILKFFLHLSKEEQRKRLLERIDEPDKTWKANAGDLVERRFWNQYMAAYEACVRATSAKTAPWHVVPADDKLNARLIVMRIVVDALRGLDLALPPMSRSRRNELQAMRRQLARHA
jgi:polyphosphate kinase 2 (PPK2 family)